MPRALQRTNFRLFLTLEPPFINDHIRTACARGQRLPDISVQTCDDLFAFADRREFCGERGWDRTIDHLINVPLRLSPPLRRVCSLDFPFTVAFALGGRRQVSTPSHRWAWLGVVVTMTWTSSPTLTPSHRRFPFRWLLQKSSALPLSYAPLVLLFSSLPVRPVCDR
jgi:hypothetical protein